jgi:hypothetical protein
MVTTPNIDGFIEATRRLRGAMGNQVTFHVPQQPQWPAGTRINPDTGVPYDAMLVRENAEFSDIVVTVGVVLKEASPLRPQSDVRFEPAGLLENMDVILDVDADDYAAVKDATEFTYADHRYRLVEWKPFEVAGMRYRWLAYGQER